MCGNREELGGFRAASACRKCRGGLGRSVLIPFSSPLVGGPEGAGSGQSAVRGQRTSPLTDPGETGRSRNPSAKRLSANGNSRAATGVPASRRESGTRLVPNGRKGDGQRSSAPLGLPWAGGSRSDGDKPTLGRWRRGGAAPRGCARVSGRPSSSGAFCCGAFYCFSHNFVIVLTLLTWFLALPQPVARERG